MRKIVIVGDEINTLIVAGMLAKGHLSTKDLKAHDVMTILRHTEGESVVEQFMFEVILSRKDEKYTPGDWKEK